MLLVILALLPISLSASVPLKAVEDFVTAAWPESGAPGLAYAAIDNGKVAAGARGTTLAGAGEPVTPDTPFLIGSVSKSFTALAVMRLVEAGKLDLDAGIGTYLGAFAGRPGGAITLRQLLSHTSGYSTVQGNGPHAETLAAHAVMVARWTPAYPPSERWEYSNTNYHLLGAVIEAVTGEDFADHMERSILAPAGMTHSFVALGEEPGGVARGHRPWFGGKQAYTEREGGQVAAPAGAIFASANDLARYAAIMLNGRDDIISAAGKAEMLRPAGAQSPFYGLGWFIDRQAGTAAHGGLVPGSEALLTLVPAERKAAIVLINANGGIGFADNGALLNGITALALRQEYRGEGSRVWPKATYVMMVLLPLLFLASMGWAWHRRERLQRKRVQGAPGIFSLWFPLATTLVMAGFLLAIAPGFFGGSLNTLLLYQPDFATCMIAAAITGPLWAMMRLMIAYRGRFLNGRFR
ncbi:serine hydrolase [Erythrobacter sp. sf7]|uniref:Serine hydrolase n=1 Tax=Erythrobacter fulvus TaxID=2987523 RepID=A0ABT5JT70_9SPHN|nr:serine hydrolase domain-containing protein [Erythrobacter fulvus]MDC8755963.1 serine hydrolase [Erythrobacter fulvus]